jgi:hypothetical protein
MQRLAERKLAYKDVIKDILSLTFIEFKNLKSKNKDIMIINLLKNYSIVFCFGEIDVRCHIKKNTMQTQRKSLPTKFTSITWITPLGH